MEQINHLSAGTGGRKGGVNSKKKTTRLKAINFTSYMGDG